MILRVCGKSRYSNQLDPNMRPWTAADFVVRRTFRFVVAEFARIQSFDQARVAEFLRIQLQGVLFN